jgi:hypothetical protein
MVYREGSRPGVREGKGELSTLKSESFAHGFRVAGPLSFFERSRYLLDKPLLGFGVTVEFRVQKLVRDLGGFALRG